MQIRQQFNTVANTKLGEETSDNNYEPTAKATFPTTFI
jgi:hypothetical protein